MNGYQSIPREERGEEGWGGTNENKGMGNKTTQNRTG